MHRDSRAYLWDIRDAALAITDFIADMDEATYRLDERTKAAVERKLEVVGEAVNQLAQLDSALAQRVSSKRQIIGMRNMLIHGYMAVDDGLVWRTVNTDIPILRVETDDLLAERTRNGE